jgi:hypothetical protein
MLNDENDKNNGKQDAESDISSDRIGLTHLSNEIVLEELFPYLDIKDICRLAQTNKHFNELAEKDYIWRDKFYQHFYVPSSVETNYFMECWNLMLYQFLERLLDDSSSSKQTLLNILETIKIFNKKLRKKRNKIQFMIACIRKNKTRGNLWDGFSCTWKEMYIIETLLFPLWFSSQRSLYMLHEGIINHLMINFKRFCKRRIYISIGTLERATNVLWYI